MAHGHCGDMQEGEGQDSDLVRPGLLRASDAQQSQQRPRGTRRSLGSAPSPGMTHTHKLEDRGAARLCPHHQRAIRQVRRRDEHQGSWFKARCSHFLTVTMEKSRHLSRLLFLVHKENLMLQAG